MVKEIFRIEKALEDFKVKLYEETMMETVATLKAERTARRHGHMGERIARRHGHRGELSARIAELTVRVERNEAANRVNAAKCAENEAANRVNAAKCAENGAKILALRAEMKAIRAENEANRLALRAENEANRLALRAENEANTLALSAEMKAMAKKKSQKVLDTARRKVERAKANLQTKIVVEKLMSEGLAEGKPVQRALTAAGKKRKNVDKKIGELEADVKTKMATFKERFKCDPAAPAPLRARTRA
jgi:hypothetical protein